MALFNLCYTIFTIRMQHYIVFPSVHNTFKCSEENLDTELQEIPRTNHTWPCAWSLSQPLETVQQVLETREGPVAAVGQHGLGVHKETRQSAGERRGSRTLPEMRWTVWTQIMEEGHTGFAYHIFLQVDSL